MLSIRAAFLVGTLFASTFLAAVPKTASGFDTGHHFDLTANAMLELGFKYDAVMAAQVNNWLCDYYNAHPAADQLEIPAFQQIKKHVGRLHFTNNSSLANGCPDEIERTWAWLVRGTRDGVELAVENDSELQLLAIIGASLHMVQDFYTHSNWAELHPVEVNTLEGVTWFDTPVADDVPLYCALGGGAESSDCPEEEEVDNPQLHMKHGNWCWGLNHDAYGRPHFKAAYASAYAATLQWMRAIWRWTADVDDSLWERTLNHEDRGGLVKDWHAAWQLSAYVDHWKGGRNRKSYPDLVRAAEWIAESSSEYVSEFRSGAYEPITRRLMADDTGQLPLPPPIPRMPGLASPRTMVVLRTLQVVEDESGLIDADTFTEADFYADVFFENNVVSREALKINDSNIKPDWESIAVLSPGQASVNIKYELWDDDGWLNGDRDICDVHPDSGKKRLQIAYDTSQDRISSLNGSQRLRDYLNRRGGWEAGPIEICGSGDDNIACLKFFLHSLVIYPGIQRDDDGRVVHLRASPYRLNQGKMAYDLGAGTERRPLGSLETAIATVRPQGRLWAHPGHYKVPALRITKALSIVPVFGGEVRIEAGHERPRYGCSSAVPWDWDEPAKHLSIR